MRSEKFKELPQDGPISKPAVVEGEPGLPSSRAGAPEQYAILRNCLVSPSHLTSQGHTELRGSSCKNCDMMLSILLGACLQGMEKKAWRRKLEIHCFLECRNATLSKLTFLSA